MNLTLKPHTRIEDSPRIEPIRVEMLSTEMPIHQLSKNSVEEIRIIQRKGKGGQISLYWKVEANSNVGHPGQLAYHLDTWVIKRRLAELRRPIPRLIRVGDLREIARELGHGGDTNAVKRAFEQNASAFIRAKLAFSSTEGLAETFEGYFNRYNVFFRGQSLPGGRKAETVYISLNDPYFTLINRSRWRPLDFEYLKRLPPMAQRFYELVSPKMFAAIKNGHPAAWMRYSDFCLLAVQKRHTTRRRMQIQMAAVHRSHVVAKYFGKVTYRPIASTVELPDWTIHYTPGPRAKAEFQAFNGGGPRGRASLSGRPLVVRSAAEPRRSASRRTAPAQEDSPALVLARRFVEKRLGTSAARITTSQVSMANEILETLEGDLDAAFSVIDLAAEEGRRNRKGFPKHLGGVIDAGYVERARAIRAEDRRRSRAELLRHRESAEHARFEDWSRQRAEQRIANLNEHARKQLVDERLPRFVEENGYFVRQCELRGESVRAWAEQRILKRYGHEGEPSFEEWRRLHDGPPANASGPDEALQ